MEMKCLVCHQRFETVNGRTICDDCYHRILHNIEHPQDGMCPVCGVQSPIISKERVLRSRRSDVQTHVVHSLHKVQIRQTKAELITKICQKRHVGIDRR